MINFENGKTPLSEETFNKLQSDLLKTVFPIGSTYITQEDTNPNTILGFGTWERLKGKVCLGLDENDTDFSIIGNTGGEKTHTLTVDEMPNRPFLFNETGTINIGSGSGTVATVIGGGQAFNNMPPYEVVGYMWIRRS